MSTLTTELSLNFIKRYMREHFPGHVDIEDEQEYRACYEDLVWQELIDDRVNNPPDITTLTEEQLEGLKSLIILDMIDRLATDDHMSVVRTSVPHDATLRAAPEEPAHIDLANVMTLPVNPSKSSESTRPKWVATAAALLCVLGALIFIALRKQSEDMKTTLATLTLESTVPETTRLFATSGAEYVFDAPTLRVTHGAVLLEISPNAAEPQEIELSDVSVRTDGAQLLVYVDPETSATHVAVLAGHASILSRGVLHEMSHSMQWSTVAHQFEPLPASIWDAATLKAERELFQSRVMWTGTSTEERRFIWGAAGTQEFEMLDRRFRARDGKQGNTIWIELLGPTDILRQEACVNHLRFLHPKIHPSRVQALCKRPDSCNQLDYKLSLYAPVTDDAGRPTPIMIFTKPGETRFTMDDPTQPLMFKWETRCSDKAWREL